MAHKKHYKTWLSIIEMCSDPDGKAFGYAEFRKYLDSIGEKWDSDALVESSIEVPVQFNGKVKAKIRVAAEISKDDLLKAALQDPKVQTLLEGKAIVKQIVVPERLVNLVVK